jgi:hypothetical protein
MHVSKDSMWQKSEIFCKIFWQLNKGKPKDTVFATAVIIMPRICMFAAAVDAESVHIRRESI